MSRDEATTIIQRIVAEVARLRDPATIPVDRDLYREVGIKSTAALDLLLSLEDAFGVAIPDERFGDARTVSSLVDLVGDLR
jgi:acyl carrier protein